MSISRYRGVSILSSSVGTQYYGTSNFPTQAQLNAIPTYSVPINQFDRLDNLAAKFFGDGTYWWILAVVNNIDWAFNFQPGQIIQIPIDVQDVLKLF